MPEKNYYSILGVSEGAGKDEIRKAFRKLAKQYHPDANKGDKNAEKRFKEISEAYEVLSDDDKRAQYDQLRQARRMGFGAAGGFDPSTFTGARGGKGGTGGATFTFEDLGDFGDLFSDIFSREPRYGAHAGRSYRPQKGEEITFSITIPFELAVRGGKTTINVPRTETCPACGGSGAEPGSKSRTCPSCGGLGSVSVSQGAFAFSRPCPQCLGRGTINTRPCKSCGGQGTVSRTRTITVNIPKGINDGAKIRLAGQGEAGIAGGPPGDLYLLVHVQPHAEFERRGNDVYSTVTVDMVQAALGTKVPVKTLDGTVTLTIPPGTQPGTRLRLRGRGVKTASGETGHHYVTVEVSVPKRLTEKQKRLLKEFAAARQRS